MRFFIVVILSLIGQLLASWQLWAESLWDIKRLSAAPKVEWLDKTGDSRRLFFEAEPYQGKPTRVFAWYAQPEKADGKLPAMVLLHGGGGKAFKQWAELWAKRGYVAIAMDLAGVGEDEKRLPDGGPPQSGAAKIPLKKIALHDVWTYHAVADAILANSLLRSLPNVDPERIGVTGISWGGYLTCIVAGVDERFKVAVPVYGCGFLHENSGWIKDIPRLEKTWRREWIANFDPSNYVGQAKMPMLFVNGTNDDSYPLDSYQKTYRLVKDRTLCITVNMPHGHPEGWAPVEIGEFADVYLKKGKPFLRLSENVPRVVEDNGRKRIVYSQLQGSPPIDEITVAFTEDVKKPWRDRAWQLKKLDFQHGGATDFWSADAPVARPIIWFATFKDKFGRTTSSEHELLEK